MKNMTWRWLAVVVCAGVAAPTGRSAALAADGREAPTERAERREVRPTPAAPGQDPLSRRVGSQLERLEQRLNQLAERQEQFMRQAGRPVERGGSQVQGGVNRPRPPMAPPPGLRRFQPAEGAPPAMRPMKSISDVLGLIVLGWITCNILLAIWIFTDIRKRGEGPALFVAVALVAGIPAAAIYALVRIGDQRLPAA